MNPHNVNLPWKEKVQTNWQEIGIEAFCVAVGIEFSKVFLEPLGRCNSSLNPWENHRWEFISHPRLVPGVLHLVPLNPSQRKVLWEEWFRDEQELHHHILGNHPHAGANHRWKGKGPDTLHPKEVLEIQWHYFNDSDLRPIDLRGPLH